MSQNKKERVQNIVKEIWGFRGGEYQDCCILGMRRRVVWQMFPVFGKNIVYILDGGSRLLRNVNSHFQNDTAIYPQRYE